MRYITLALCVTLPCSCGSTQHPLYAHQKETRQAGRDKCAPDPPAPQRRRPLGVSPFILVDSRLIRERRGRGQKLPLAPDGGRSVMVGDVQLRVIAGVEGAQP